MKKFLLIILIIFLSGCDLEKNTSEKITLEGSDCSRVEDCINIDCRKYDNPSKSGYVPDCVQHKCRCMCFGCK